MMYGRVCTPTPDVLSSQFELVGHTSFYVFSDDGGQVGECSNITRKSSPDLAVSAGVEF